MKRESEPLFLRAAFRPEPDPCHTALMRAARSVKEDKQVKRVPFRTIWIAAIILIAMTAAAFAVTNAGLVDWFGSQYGAELPQAAQDVLAATEQKTFIVGPISYTVKETMTDGRVAYLTVEAKTADGAPALLNMGDTDPNDFISEYNAAILDMDGITATTTFADAARITGLPLYYAKARMEPEGDVMAGEEMMDTGFREDGSVLLIDMLYTDPEAVGDALTVDIILRSVEIDPETLEYVNANDWVIAETRTIPVTGVTATRSYAVTSTEKLGGSLTITGVTAEQTCAGVYITVHATADEGITLPRLYSNHELQVLNAQGKRFPTGISLTSGYRSGDGSAFPNDRAYTVADLQYRMMITVDTFPDSLIVTDGTTEILAEAVTTDEE